MAGTIEDVIRHLLDSLGEGVIFFDPDNKVRWTNETFDRMRGESESLMGRSIFDCHPAKDHGRVSQILNDLRIGRETIRPSQAFRYHWSRKRTPLRHFLYGCQERAGRIPGHSHDHPGHWRDKESSGSGSAV
jgi:PAS domain-containing protein